MVQKILGAQRDFSAGEIDASMKRADEHPARKAGMRQASNFRIRNSGALEQRSGRSALFVEAGRVEEVLMSPGNKFFLVFGNGYLRVYNAAGTRVFNSTVKGDGSTAIPWTTATVKNVVFIAYKLVIYIAYGDDAPVNVPQVLTWDGVSQSSTWTLSTFAETVTASGQKRTPFYRLSPLNVTLLPSATQGNIHIQFSAAVLVSGQIGTRLRWCGRQIIITGCTTSNFSTPTAGPSQYGTATVVEPLPYAQQLNYSTSTGSINIGDLLIGSTSGAQGIVTQAANTQTVVGGATRYFNVGDTMTGGTSGATGIVTAAVYTTQYGDYAWAYTVSLNTSTAFQVSESLSGGSAHSGSDTSQYVTANSIYVQLLANASNIITQFANETVAGPNGTVITTSETKKSPQAVSVWDDEVMNLYRGYPTSIFFDQVRLGLCNFPALPAFIAWSGIAGYFDFYTDASNAGPANSVQELAPANSQVLFVVPGQEGSEFVFCDNAVYYIPISVTNPLKPGSVAFNLLSKDGCAPNVVPRAVQEVILFMNSGNSSLMAILAPGAYARPYEVANVTELHSHLVKSPIAIAVPASTSQFEERYAYLLNNDGTLSVGKYTVKSGQIVGVVGWLPWNGAGSVTWIAALQSDVVFTTTYAGPVSIVELLDNTQYLDAAILVNSAPAALAPPGGGLTGPLWFWASQTVSLLDQGYRSMGTYSVDASGNIIPQNNGGENLAAATLVAGQPWIATAEPFVPDAPAGTSVGQRMFKRRVSRMAAAVKDSTGFLMARLFSGPLTRTSPALGTVMNNYRVTAWNQDDDATKPPPLREEVQRWRPLGRSFDPRVAIIKDTPGKLTIEEFGIEATI